LAGRLAGKVWILAQTFLGTRQDRPIEFSQVGRPGDNMERWDAFHPRQSGVGLLARCCRKKATGSFGVRRAHFGYVASMDRKGNHQRPEPLDQFRKGGNRVTPGPRFAYENLQSRSMARSIPGTKLEGGPVVNLHGE